MLISFLLSALGAVTEDTYLTGIARLDEKDSIVYITREGKKYHKDRCSYLKRNKLKITFSEAVNNRYTPCKRCYKITSDSTSTQ